jgi:hypothetical protein
LDLSSFISFGRSTGFESKGPVLNSCLTILTSERLDARKRPHPRRTLSNDERILLEWLLARPSSDVSGSDVSQYKSQVAKLRVVAKCGCGCPTVDFALGADRKVGASEIVAEAGGKSPEGVFVGVILHARKGELSELEVYSTQGLDTSFTLPVPDSLENYE